jgi:hypothetical protein
MPHDRQPGKERNQEPLDVGHDPLQWHSLNVQTILGIERGPLALL